MKILKKRFDIIISDHFLSEISTPVERPSSETDAPPHNESPQQLLHDPRDDNNRRSTRGGGPVPMNAWSLWGCRGSHGAPKKQGHQAGSL